MQVLEFEICFGVDAASDHYLSLNGPCLAFCLAGLRDRDLPAFLASRMRSLALPLSLSRSLSLLLSFFSLCLPLDSGFGDLPLCFLLESLLDLPLRKCSFALLSGLSESLQKL